MSHSTFSPGLLYPDRFTYLLPPFSHVKPYHHHAAGGAAAPHHHHSHHGHGHHHTSSRTTAAPVYTIPAAAGGGGGAMRAAGARAAYVPAAAAAASLYPGHQYLYKDYKIGGGGGGKGILPRSARLDKDRSAWQRPYTPSDYIF